MLLCIGGHSAENRGRPGAILAPRTVRATVGRKGIPSTPGKSLNCNNNTVGDVISGVFSMSREEGETEAVILSSAILA